METGAITLGDHPPAGAGGRLHLTLITGKAIVPDRIKLFPARDLEKAVALRTQAGEQLAGYTSGIGFIGSPGLALGAAATLGFLESVVSNAKAKKGVDLLAKAEEQFAKTRSLGVFIPIQSITGLENPDPSHWRASQLTSFEINFRSMGILESGRAVQQYGLKKADIVEGIAKVSEDLPYTFDGDEFVWVEVNQRATAIRWSSVIEYELR